MTWSGYDDISNGSYYMCSANNDELLVHESKLGYASTLAVEPGRLTSNVIQYTLNINTEIHRYYEVKLHL